MRRSFVCFCFCCFDSPLFCVFVRADPIGSGDGGQSRPVSTLDLFFYRFPFFIISFRFRFMLRFVFVCFGFLFFRFFFVSQKRMRRTRNAKAETKENVGFLFQRKKNLLRSHRDDPRRFICGPTTPQQTNNKKKPS